MRVLASASSRRERTGARLWIGGLLVVVVVAVAASWWASDAPDGLERVAEDHGFASAADDHDMGGSPLADYRAEGIGGDGLAGAVAGLAGVGVTLLIGGGLLWLLRRRPSRATEPDSS